MVAPSLPKKGRRGKGRRGRKRSKKKAVNCVVVDDALGFVQGHVIEGLLRLNATVHAVLRGPPSGSQEAQLAYLRSAADTAGTALHLFQGSRSDRGATLAAALNRHSPTSCLPAALILSAVDPDDAALAIGLAADSIGIEKVVLASSVSTLAPTRRKTAHRPYHEGDINDVARPGYGSRSLSRRLTDQAAFTAAARASSLAAFSANSNNNNNNNNIIKGSSARKRSGAPHGSGLRLVSLHLPWVVGPVQSRHLAGPGNMAVRALLRQELPVVLPLAVHLVDVRDAARAFIAVVRQTGKKASGGRFIVANDPAVRWCDLPPPPPPPRRRRRRYCSCRRWLSRGRVRQRCLSFESPPSA